MNSPALNDSSSPLILSSEGEQRIPIADSLSPNFWAAPDFTRIMAQRQANLTRIRKDSGLLSAVKQFYRDDHFVEFIRDWGMMRDPRLASSGKKTVFPFIPFPRQEELFRWFHAKMKQKERGNVDKTRDCGASWCALAYSCWHFLFFDNHDIGFGSRKEDLIDSKGDPKTLFHKAREFIRLLPVEFRPAGWDERKHAPYLKLINPENNSTIVGESGDNIGRGGRTLIYFVDEHAYVERPLLAEAALSENTNTQINISTHNGPGTLFYKQCTSLPEDRVFIFDWRDDPRKTQTWYDKKKNDPATDPIVFAQEVDRDPSATIADGFIKENLMSEAMNNHPGGIVSSGPYIVSVDVAAMGNDKSIINTRRGAINFPQIKFRKMEGDQLAAEVERHCDNLLRQGIAPLGAIIYELEGPGYGLHTVLKNGRYAEACRPIHPGRKLQSREFYNERARFWQYALEWLQEGNRSMTMDRILKLQATSIRYNYKIGANGERRLLVESKKEYRSRMAMDPKNKMAGPSPDDVDAWAMGFAPVKLARIIKPAQVGILPDDLMPKQGGTFTPLDSAVGY